jgi:hypothetical protein
MILFMIKFFWDSWDFYKFWSVLCCEDNNFMYLCNNNGFKKNIVNQNNYFEYICYSIINTCSALAEKGLEPSVTFLVRPWSL